MAENQEDKYKISFETNADQTSQKVDGLTDSVNQTAKAQKSLKTQVLEANIELQNAVNKYGETSKEAIASAKAVAELKDQMKFAQDLSASFDPDQKFKALGAATQIAGTGLQGVTSGMALFGDQSKDTQEQLLKVQSAMAFADAISGLSDLGDQWKLLKNVVSSSTVAQKLSNATMVTAGIVQKAFTGSVDATSTSFKGLRVAIAGTGIGLLVTGLALVVNNFDSIKNAIFKVVPGLENIGKIIKNLFNSVTDFIGVTSKADRALDALKERSEQALKQNEKYLKLNEHNLSESEKKKLEINNEYWENVKSGEITQAQALKIFKEKNAKIDQEELEKRLEKEKEIREKAEQKRIEKEKKAEEEKKKREQDEAQRRQAVLNKERELQKQLEDLQDDTEQKKLDRQRLRDVEAINQLETSGKKKQELIDQLNKIYFEKQSQLDQKEKDDQAKKQQEFLEQYKLDTQNKIEYDNEIFETGLDAKFEQAMLEIENEKAIAEAKAEELGGTPEEIEERKLQISAFYNQKAIEEEDKLVEAKKDLKKKETDAINDLQNQAFNVAKDIFGKNKQIQKGIILAEGGVALGKVIKNTTEGVSKAIASSPLTVGMPWSGIIGAKGILDGATIVSSTNKALQSLGGGGSLNSSGATPQAQGVSATPQVGIQASSENQIATSVANAQREQPPIKAFVVSKEVTTAQTLDANLIEENTI